MDPATVSLIFMGIRAVSQGLKAKGRRDLFLTELETFLTGVHAEGRTASPEEVMEFALRAAKASTDYQAQLEKFLEAIGEGPTVASGGNPSAFSNAGLGVESFGRAGFGGGSGSENGSVG